MRAICGFAGAGLLLMLGVVGTASGAPVYDPGAVVEPEYGPGPLRWASEEALWAAMTDPGPEEPGEGPVDYFRGLRADVYGDGERPLYEAAVGLFPQITFAELGGSQTLTDQYLATSGVDFTDGDDQVIQASWFPEDWWGVDGGSPPTGTITIEFVVPQLHVGFDFPGYLDVELYAPNGRGLVWSGSFGGPGAGHFAGIDLASEGLEFNQVVLSDPDDGSAFMDTLYYQRIPEPGTAFLLGFGALALVRWKR